MKWKPSRNAAENARVMLPRLAEKYFEAGREASDGKRSPKELHRFRIATKRFRYTLEMFRPVYGQSLERRLKPLRELQHVLGKLNDLHTIHELVGQDASLGAKLKRATAKKLKEFQEQWQTFDTDGQLKGWKAYLGRKRSI